MTNTPHPQTSPEKSIHRTKVAWCGRIVGPVLSVVCYLSLKVYATDMTPQGPAAAAIVLLLAIWWMTEAFPLPATSLLPLVLFPLSGVMSIDQTAAQYANKMIFLFMGGFMIALAVERWGLHQRIALLTISVVGTKPPALIGGFMIATAFLSMWISNTAATAMMLPIGLSVVTLVATQLDKNGLNPQDSEKAKCGFSICLMLAIAYSASVGGLGTFVGTPTNIILVENLKDNGIEIGFGQWMCIALPLVIIFLTIIWLVLTRVLFPIRIKDIPGGHELIRQELLKLGAMSRGEISVLCVFTGTALMWVLRGPLTKWDWLVEKLPVIANLNDTIIAMTGALLLFAIPVNAKEGVFALDWKTAQKLPWGVLLLFGGGLTLAEAIQASGLDGWIVHRVEMLGGLPVFLFVMALTACVIFLTEVTSNTPTAAVFLPFLGGVAIGIGVDPMLLIVPAGIAASCAFMLPVATPPNAIVFGGGHITIGQMAKAGFWFNLIGILLIPLVMYFLGPLVLGMKW